MDIPDHKQIRSLFDNYLEMYASRDDRLTFLFSEDFSGFTGSGDFLVKTCEEWLAITRQDFEQVKDPIRMELLDLSIQSLSDAIAVTTALIKIHLPIKEHVLSRRPVRLVLIFRKEYDCWKISHCSYSLSDGMAREGEIFPVQELEERNLFLEKQVAEQTAQLFEANKKLQRANEILEMKIAEQAQIEETLRKSEYKYRLLAENASDVVWKLDSEYRFTYVSQADERLRGYRADEMLGHHIYELFNEEGIATVKKSAQLRQEAEQRGATAGTLTFDAEHRRKDGSWVWAEVRYSTECDAEGNTIGLYGITRDITDRKLAEDELRRAKAAAEEASKVKSQFLATMSHEIRTPLNALVGFSTLAQTATDPDKINQYISILEQSSRSLMDLVNNILDMSKIEAGRLEFEAVPINLRQLVTSLKEQYSHLANQKMLKFRVFMTDNLPVWVLGDPVRLRQILTNLLSNAVKFTERGEVSWTISNLEKEGAQVVRFKVRDTGIGIPESFQPGLFQPFRQLDPTISRKFGGTGLGLAIVHNLTTLQGGSIALESQEGAGSCFTVDMPLQETEPLSESLLATPAKLASYAILVVEDNEFNRRLLGDILTSWGQRVTLAENGIQALDFMEQHCFDLMLLDIRMPDIDGIEVARRVRELEQDSFSVSVPIIAITADADAATREACLGVGIDAVLAKPVIPEQLARAVAIYLTSPGAVSSGDELLLNIQAQKGLGGDPERTRTFREMLLKDIEDELQSLQAALKCEDRDNIGLAAHTMKGLCGYLDNRELAEQVAWLQQNSPSARPDQIRQIIEQMRTILS
ncbi:MAG: response regulator [Geobacteraceae bacterium]|nr:response regulator [Geobacteraceae bacterium]